MPTMNSKTYLRGYLGYSVTADMFSESTMVKSSGRISLFETESPSGTNYVVVLDYGDVNAEVLFPTPSNPSRSGNKRVTKSASEAFAKFDEMVAVYGGVSTDSSGITGKAGSFEELDVFLLSQATLPVDIITELQRTGTNTVGRPKAVLDLKFSTGILSRVVGRPTEGQRMARLYYEAIPSEQRIFALKDMRPSILEKYMSGTLISSLIMTNKEKRKIYQQELMKNRYKEVPMHVALNSIQVTDQSPSVAIQVRFIDQKGKEVKGLPYEIACRGALNFVEAAKATNFGSSPGDFSSGRTLFEIGMTGMDSETNQAMVGALVETWNGRSLSPDAFYHLLYEYRADGTEGLPPGSIKLSITTPRNTNSMLDWGNPRLMVYPSPSNASESREGEPRPAQSKTLLFSHNYRLEKGGDPMRLVVNIPIYVEPLPMHLVEMPAGSGNIVSRWSVTEDIGAIPSHQKVNLSLKVLRPTATNKWEEADKMLPTDRPGYDDKKLQFEEFISPEGRAAYRESMTEVSPVEGVKFALIPDSNNSWITSKQLTILSPDFTGMMKAEITPGTYRLKMLVQIKADGTTGMRPVSQSDAEFRLASRFDSFDQNLRAAIMQKYPDQAIERSTMFAPETVEIGIIEAPAGFFYLNPNETDTTPVGVVGVKITKTGSLADLGTSRFKDFKLQQNIPPLPKGQTPEAGSIFDMMGIDYPNIDAGWPPKDPTTDARFFDTATIFLSPDSTIDLSMIQAYEQRYEAQRDTTSKVQSRLIAPGVGQSIEYNGFIIEHLLFDTSVGPTLLNTEGALSGGVQEYDMGKITTPFFEVGVVRALVFYPKSGTMRRKIMLPGNRNPNPSLVVSARSTQTSWNAQQASLDRVYYFDVKSSPEGAVLSGRWVPLETIGEYSMQLAPENEAFDKIIQSIKRGGLPIRSSAKWNQFWSSTGDGWLFGGDPIVGEGAVNQIVNATSPNQGINTSPAIEAGDISSVFNGQSSLVSPPSSLMSMMGTNPLHGKLESEGNISFDALVAPNPDYGDLDEDMGFVEG